jgi:hypothetical protein
MNTRFYRSQGLDARRMAHDLQGIFYAQGYQVQQLNNNKQIMLQLRKGGDFEAILGMQAALTVTLQPVQGGIIALVGQQQWVDKAAAGVLGLMLLWPLAITAGAGAIRQATFESEIFQMLDTVAFQQRPDVQVGPVPDDLASQAQQQFYQGQPPQPAADQNAPRRPEPHYAPPPQRPEPHYAPPTPKAQPPEQKVEKSGNEAIQLPGRGQKQCNNCLEINDEDDAYCSRCGTSLRQQTPIQHCNQCNAVLKAGAAFCTKCGTSVPQPSGKAQQQP